MRYRLLLVDDDPLNLDALSRVLKQDYDLVRAESAEAALQILRDEGRHIDVILADKSMPGKSGLTLLEEAKSLSSAMRIVLTAFPEASELIEAINRGEVYRYVSKPWRPDELKVVVAHALERHQLLRDNAELIAELKRKNTELRAMATRVADAYLARIEQSTGSAEPLALRDVLAAAAYPAVRSAAQAIIEGLSRARAHIRTSDAVPEAPRGDLGYFEVVTSACLSEAQRILSVVSEIEEIGNRSFPVATIQRGNGTVGTDEA